MALPRYILHRQRNPSTDQYLLHANVDPGGSDEYAPVAMMRVQRYGNSPMHVPANLKPTASSEASRYWVNEHAKPGETPPMFAENAFPQSVHHELSELYTTERHRTLSLPLAGVAEMTARRETGRDVVPSQDLSPYSHQFVQHLANIGVVPQHQVASAPVNNLDFMTMEQHSAAWKTHPQLQSEAASGDLLGYRPAHGATKPPIEDLTASGDFEEGRRAMRSTLRAARPKRTQHFEQGTLF